jgi:hypothetical protein
VSSVTLPEASGVLPQFSLRPPGINFEYFRPFGRFWVHFGSFLGCFEPFWRQSECLRGSNMADDSQPKFITLGVRVPEGILCFCSTKTDQNLLTATPGPFLKETRSYEIGLMVAGIFKKKSKRKERKNRDSKKSPKDVSVVSDSLRLESGYWNVFGILPSTKKRDKNAAELYINQRRAGEGEGEGEGEGGGEGKGERAGGRGAAQNPARFFPQLPLYPNIFSLPF